MIRFATFNVGQGQQDFTMMLPDEGKKQYREEINTSLAANFSEEQLNHPTNEQVKEMNGVQAKAVEEIMTKIERSVAVRLSDQCDVIALQEVGNHERPFIKTLEERGFVIYSCHQEKNTPSTAIALRAEMFVNNPENRSILSYSKGNTKEMGIYGQEIASVKALHKESNVELTFSSLHSWGFQLYNPNLARENEKQITSNDPNVKKGINYTKEAFNNLPKRTYSVLAGDMNNNLENQPEQFNFINKQGFEILEPDQITNINRGDLEYQERKIDFIFVPKKPSLFKRIFSFAASFVFSKTVLAHTPAKVLEGFDYTYQGNCSDHKPFATTLTITKVPSKIARFTSYIYNKVFG
jgi:hypothetical protein